MYVWMGHIRSENLLHWVFCNESNRTFPMLKRWTAMQQLAMVGAVAQEALRRNDWECNSYREYEIEKSKWEIEMVYSLDLYSLLSSGTASACIAFIFEILSRLYGCLFKIVWHRLPCDSLASAISCWLCWSYFHYFTCKYDDSSLLY